MENSTKTIIYVAGGIAVLGVLYLVLAPKPATPVVPVAAKPAATSTSSSSLVSTATGLVKSLFGSGSSDTPATSAIPASQDTSNSLADVTNSTTVSNASPAASLGASLINTAPTLDLTV